MSLLAPAALLGGLLALPILALYFLRQRRRPQVVSSLLLWQRALQDRAANAWWQRLQRHLLLWVQLAALALMVLALARPALPQASAVRGRSVLLLDASASMAARQPDSASARWQAALDEAERLLATLDGAAGDEALLLAIDDQARLLAARTSDLGALRAALAEAAAQAPTRPAAASAWQSAFNLAQAEAQGAPDSFQWFILSDGGLPTELALPPGLPAPRFIPIGQDAPNLALSALALRAQGPALRAFLRLVNHGPQPAEASVTLRLDGRLWDARRLTLPAQGAQSLSLSLEGQSFQTLSASLSAEPSLNALSLDDAAYAVAPQASAARVLLVSDGRASDRFIEQALAVVAARRLIVEAAVGMVREALAGLEAAGLPLDEERKAAMVNNLMVALVSEAQAQPVVNVGTLYT